MDKYFTMEINKVILGFFNEYLKNDLSNWAEDLTKNYKGSTIIMDPDNAYCVQLHQCNVFILDNQYF